MGEDSFFSRCNQAKIFGTYSFNELPGLHREWYINSSKYLNVPVPTHGRWPSSITPMTMHAKTVLSMLKYIGEDPNPYNLCNGPLCEWLSGGATEFTLYLIYAHAEKKDMPSLNCTHVIKKMDWGHEVAVSLWRGLTSHFH